MANERAFEDLGRTLGEFLRRASNPLPALREISQMQVSSIVENFRLGGRPTWTPSKRVRRRGGQTLLVSGRLMKSLTLPNVTERGIEFGSNLPYFRVHQEGAHFPARSELFIRKRISRGATKGRFKRGTEPGRGFTSKAYEMLPRPMVVFQPADVASAGEILLRHLLPK